MKLKEKEKEIDTRVFRKLEIEMQSVYANRTKTREAIAISWGRHTVCISSSLCTTINAWLWLRHTFAMHTHRRTNSKQIHTLVRSTQLKLIWISRNTSENANRMPIIFFRCGVWVFVLVRCECLCADRESVCACVVYFVNNNNNRNNSSAFQSHQIKSARLTLRKYGSDL